VYRLVGVTSQWRCAVLDTHDVQCGQAKAANLETKSLVHLPDYQATSKESTAICSAKFVVVKRPSRRYLTMIYCSIWFSVDASLVRHLSGSICARIKPPLRKPSQYAQDMACDWCIVLRWGLRIHHQWYGYNFISACITCVRISGKGRMTYPLRHIKRSWTPMRALATAASIWASRQAH